MLMPPERVEYFNKILEQHFHRLVLSIRRNQALRAEKTPELANNATRLWELNQRYRLVKDRNKAASFALLSECKEAYKGLYNSILKIEESLDEVSIQVLELEKECQQLTKELESPGTPVRLKELLDFLEGSLKFLQNQMKYLELHLRQLHPKQSLGESALEAFKAELQLPEQVEAHMALGLAKIERFLKNPMDYCT